MADQKDGTLGELQNLAIYPPPAKDDGSRDEHFPYIVYWERENGDRHMNSFMSHAEARTFVEFLLHKGVASSPTP